MQHRRGVMMSTYPKRLVDGGGGGGAVAMGIAANRPLQLAGEAARPLTRGEHDGESMGGDGSSGLRACLQGVEGVAGRELEA